MYVIEEAKLESISTHFFVLSNAKHINYSLLKATLKNCLEDQAQKMLCFLLFFQHVATEDTEYHLVLKESAWVSLPLHTFLHRVTKCYLRINVP